MHASHCAGLVHVCHAAFRQLTSLPLQPLASRPPNTTPVGVYLLPLVLLSFPVPAPPVRFRNVTTAACCIYILHGGTTVITLVGHHLFDASQTRRRLAYTCFRSSFFP